MANVRPTGKWAMHWNHCQNCGTAEIPHKADGLCNRCYLWAYRQAKRAGFLTTRAKESGKLSRRKATTKDKK